MQCLIDDKNDFLFDMLARIHLIDRISIQVQSLVSLLDSRFSLLFQAQAAVMIAYLTIWMYHVLSYFSLSGMNYTIMMNYVGNLNDLLIGFYRSKYEIDGKEVRI